VQLKVGDLARHSGLTVRTLHHYDHIGLLSPSARSDAGYRLYSQDDVARLHAIQALRHLGLSLPDIARMLTGERASAQAIVARQIRALDHQITQSIELRGRLSVLQGKLSEGSQPEMDDWLGSLALMSTYGKYFSAAELKLIFDNWKKVEADWLPLFDAVRRAMDRGLPADSLEIQPLVHRWMVLMVRWMDGDFDLMMRWGQMYEQEPSAVSKRGPDHDMTRYISRAIDHRRAVLGKYFDLPQMRRLARVDEAEWRALDASVKALLRRDASPQGRAAQAVLSRWLGLLDAVTDGDATMQERLLLAYQREPLLQASALLDPAVSGFLQRAREAAQRQAA